MDKARYKEAEKDNGMVDMRRNKKYFSELVDEYFIRWIGAATWYTKHPCDKERFYKFVRSIQKFSKKEYSAKEIENKIKEAVINYHCHFNKDELERIAKELSFIAIHCLEYAEVWINPFYDFKNYLGKILAGRR